LPPAKLHCRADLSARTRICQQGKAPRRRNPCAVDALNRFGDRARVTKGLLHWIGFRTATVAFDCDTRNGGKSSFNFRRLSRFALDGIIAFSSFPLRVWSSVGAAISLGSILYSLYFFIRTLIVGADE
jgi:hypothetical protein